MDNIDKKILYELDKNSKDSFLKIGKKIRVSKETVRYRFERLIKEGIIDKMPTIINSSILGYSYYQLFLKLQNINTQKKEEIIKFLIKNTKISWIGDLEGRYDLGIILVIKSQEEIRELMEEINKKFKSIIMKKSLSINLEGEFLNRSYLIESKREISENKNYIQNKREEIIDSKDEIICKELAKDSRISYVELSKKIKLSADAILVRVKKLIQREIIKKPLLIINNEKINQQHYKILFYLTKTDKEQISRLISSIKLNNRVISLVKVLAEWDYEVDIEIEKMNQLKEFLMNLTDSFSDLIRDYEILRINNMPKYNFYPL